MSTIVIAAVVVAVGLVGFVAYRFIAAWLKTRGARVITCPETHATAAVSVNSAAAAAKSLIGSTQMTLRDCSRWPDRRDCDQACMRQIEAAPDGCLARTMLESWYEEKDCVVCSESMTPINWLDQKPGLRLADGAIVTWSDVRPETLPEVLQSSDAVCFNCSLTEAFRQRHPELVIDRPWKEPIARQHN